MSRQHGTQQKHEFAVYLATIDSYKNITHDNSLVLDDPTCIHRLRHVLRLDVHDILVLFGTHHWLRVQIVQVKKNEFIVRVIECHQLHMLTPHIDVAVPLLERSAFEETIAMLTILGATSIIPYTSQKTKRSDITQGERDRLQRVIIAAAEQSKQYVLPMIHQVITFEKVMQGSYDACIAFDQIGKTSSEVMKTLSAMTSLSKLLVVCGPEGDFVEQERMLLQQYNAYMCRLTPTVLRTEHAYIVGVGMLRSFLS